MIIRLLSGFATFSNLEMQHSPKMFCNFLQTGLAKNTVISESCQTDTNWNYKNSVLYTTILNKQSIIYNLQELCDLMSQNKRGLQKCLPVIIDGDNIVERLLAKQIDFRFIASQLSMGKLVEEVEKLIFRKCGMKQIYFSTEFACENSYLIDRWRREGNPVIIYKDISEFYEKVTEVFFNFSEAVVISNKADLFVQIRNQIEQPYIFTISFGDDISADIIPLVSPLQDIFTYINNCFNYQEENHYNIRKMTEDDFRELIANGNDNLAHQLRVSKNGDVYLSIVTTNVEMPTRTKFWWETMDANTKMVGPLAASDNNYIHQEFLSLLQNWRDDCHDLIDY